MTLNLSKRILTSIVLLLIVFICLFLNNFFWISLLLIVSIITFYEFNNLIIKIIKNKRKEKFILNILILIYLIFFIYIGYNLNQNSQLDLIFILLLCIFSDTGGYVVGKSIGGKKLTKISPNKTISGSIGSFLFSIFPIILFSEILKNKFELIIITNDIYKLILTCLFLSLVCQLGDLFISYLKRKAKIKDTGNILPGHGGLLDRIDGLIFVFPAAYILSKLFF